MHLGEIVKNYRLEQNLSMGQFAIKSGLSKAYISMLEQNLNPSTNKEITPSVDAIKKVAKAMNIDFSELFNSLSNNDDITLNTSLINPIFDGDGYVELRVIPVGSSCGYGSNNSDYPLTRERFPKEFIQGKKIDDYFLSYARGISMEKAGIHDNDLLLFREQNTLEDGEIGLFTYKGEEYIKRFKKFDGGVMLISESYELLDPIIITDNGSFIIRAKLSKLIKDFDS